MEAKVMYKFDENALVVTSNPLISGKFPKSLTPREIDLLKVLFTTIKKDAKDIAKVRINIKDLIKIFGLEKSNSAYDDIAEISKRLLTRVVQVYNKEENRLTQYQWLSCADYFYNEGYADFSFHENLKPYLLEISEYTKYILKPFMALDSFYAKRIYELLVQYRNIPREKDGTWRRTISVLEIREFLGIEKKEYTRYDNFKARVLEISKVQINERTDIYLEYEELRLGRGVKSICFIVREQRQAQTVLPIADEATEAPTGSANLTRLLAHGVMEATARRLVAEHSADVIVYNINQLERSQKSAKATKIANPAGWLIDAIEADRGEQLSLFERKQQEARATFEQKTARKAQLQTIINKITKAYRQYRVKTIQECIYPLTDEQERRLSQKFEAFLKEKGEKRTILIQKISNGKSFWYTEYGIFDYIVNFLSNNIEGFNIININEFAEKENIYNYNDLYAEYKVIEQEL